MPIVISARPRPTASSVTSSDQPRDPERQPGRDVDEVAPAAREEGAGEGDRHAMNRTSRPARLPGGSLVAPGWGSPHPVALPVARVSVRRARRARAGRASARAARVRRPRTSLEPDEPGRRVVVAGRAGAGRTGAGRPDVSSSSPDGPERSSPRGVGVAVAGGRSGRRRRPRRGGPTGPRRLSPPRRPERSSLSRRAAAPLVARGRRRRRRWPSRSRCASGSSSPRAAGAASRARDRAGAARLLGDPVTTATGPPTAPPASTATAPALASVAPPPAPATSSPTRATRSPRPSARPTPASPRAAAASAPWRRSAGWARPVHELAHGAVRDAEFLGDLVLRAPFDRDPQQRLALALGQRRQPGQRLADDGAALGQLGRARRRRAACRAAARSRSRPRRALSEVLWTIRCSHGRSSRTSSPRRSALQAETSACCSASSARASGR